MNKRDLKYFMRESAKREEIVTAPGPESILGEDGKPVTLEIKVLNSEAIQKINDNYVKRSIAVDKKGNPYISGGEVAFRTERDNARASRHMLVEALVYPDLKDKELMAYYDCDDITDMPLRVFPKMDEYAYVNRVVMAALGLISEPEDESGNSLIEEAKNS